MTARDRKLVLWLRDFMEDQCGSVDYMPTIRRMDAAKAMCERWLAVDDKRRLALEARPKKRTAVPDLQAQIRKILDGKRR